MLLICAGTCPLHACAGMPAVEEREYKIEFLQIYLSKPTITESDGETSILFPKEARLRNLT